MVRLESLATASREYGALQNMHHLTTLGAALLHASPNPPPSKPSHHHHHQHLDASCCVQEDALVSLSMRLMRESAAADLATDDAVDGDRRGLSSWAQEAGAGDRAPPFEEGEMRDGATATKTSPTAMQAAAVAVNGDQARAAKEPSALLRLRADALSRTVGLCDGLFVNEQLLRTEVFQPIECHTRARITLFDVIAIRITNTCTISKQSLNIRSRLIPSRDIPFCMPLPFFKQSFSLSSPGNTKAGQTVITQLRALKKHWSAPVRDAAKSALANWKDQVAKSSSASSARITAASASHASHASHNGDSDAAAPSAVRSGLPTRPPSLEARLWSEVNGNSFFLNSCPLNLLLLEVYVVNANALKKTAHFLFCFKYTKSTYRQEPDAPAVFTLFMSLCVLQCS